MLRGGFWKLRRRTAMALADVLGCMGVRGVRLTDALVRVSSTGPDEFVIRAILRLGAGNAAGPSVCCGAIRD